MASADSASADSEDFRLGSCSGMAWAGWARLWLWRLRRIRVGRLRRIWRLRRLRDGRLRRIWRLWRLWLRAYGLALRGEPLWVWVLAVLEPLFVVRLVRGRGRALRLFAADQHRERTAGAVGVGPGVHALRLGPHLLSKEGNYALALQRADAALVGNPNDSSLHEFRALCLFALGRYDESASALYAVLSVGPGWDWPTLIGLYPTIDIYTAQLRALEDYEKANAQSSTSRFVLAYHYLTQGHIEAAANLFKQVVALKPDDTLSAKLLEQLQSTRQNPTGSGAQAPSPPEPVSVNTSLPEGATISGTWTAQRNPDTSVTLTIQPGGAFQWQVNQKGQTQQFSGTANFGSGILTLLPDKSPPIVGRVSWTDLNHMTFRVVGDRPDSPGLSFSK